MLVYQLVTITKQFGVVLAACFLNFDYLRHVLELPANEVM